MAILRAARLSSESEPENLKLGLISGRPTAIAHGQRLSSMAADNCGVPPENQLPIEDIIDLQEHFADFVTALTLEVDGTVIGDDKTELDPFLIDVTEFSYFVPDEDSLYDVFGLDFAGTCSPSFSAGYYVMLSLARGEHTVHFSAAQVSGFALDVTYNLTVR